MPNLSDTQLLVLAAAAQREDRNLLPLPGSLRGSAAVKVVGALLARGLVAETVTDSMVAADAALNRFWRNDAEGHAIPPHITDAGLAALGIEDASTDAAAAGEAAEPQVAELQVAEPDAALLADVETAEEGFTTPEPAAPRRSRPDSKQARLIDMLRSPEGVTIAEVAAALDWHPHTVRGAIARALKKKLGLEVTSEKVEGRGRVYRIER